jgi:two-component system sensor histidine kinase CiaH
MRARRRWHNPIVNHAARVAIVATLVLGAMYVCVVSAFNHVATHRLVAQIDTRLDQLLDQAVRQPTAAAGIDRYDNAHDVEDAPVFLWRVSATGQATALTPGAPRLLSSVWSRSENSVEGRLGSETFRLQSQAVSGQWLVAGQSLADAKHIESDLFALEVIAGPILLTAVFFGTLLVGIKAAGPVELARRRQLEFTADASHELRTPLSVIEAEVSLALGSPRTVDEYRSVLGRVSGESLRLRDIVEDLLWLSRFDSEPPPPGDEPVDVSAIAAACVDRFDAVAMSRGIVLSVLNRVEGQPWINAPPEWIDRLTAVLVDNACRYAGNDGIVRVTVFALGNRVTLVVEDNGPGIAPEERSRLFDRFHRATDEGNGAGLGLAIADAVVRTTGGEWAVGDADLGGTRMEVGWHRSPGAKEMGTRREPDHHVPTSPTLDSGRSFVS